MVLGRKALESGERMGSEAGFGLFAVSDQAEWFRNYKACIIASLFDLTGLDGKVHRVAVFCKEAAKGGCDVARPVKRDKVSCVEREQP